MIDIAQWRASIGLYHAGRSTNQAGTVYVQPSMLVHEIIKILVCILGVCAESMSHFTAGYMIFGVSLCLYWYQQHFKHVTCHVSQQENGPGLPHQFVRLEMLTTVTLLILENCLRTNPEQLKKSEPRSPHHSVKNTRSQSLLALACSSLVLSSCMCNSLSIANVRRMLLLIAGDVERNPGPETPTFQELAVIPFTETKWYQLGLALKLERFILDAIIGDHSNVTKYKRAMLKKWLENTQNPTWVMVAEALRKIGESEAATAVEREYIIPADEKHLTVIKGGSKYAGRRDGKISKAMGSTTTPLRARASPIGDVASIGEPHLSKMSAPPETLSYRKAHAHQQFGPHRPRPASTEPQRYGKNPEVKTALNLSSKAKNQSPPTLHGQSNGIDPMHLRTGHQKQPLTDHVSQKSTCSSESTTHKIKGRPLKAVERVPVMDSAVAAVNGSTISKSRVGTNGAAQQISSTHQTGKMGSHVSPGQVTSGTDSGSTSYESALSDDGVGSAMHSLHSPQTDQQSKLATELEKAVQSCDSKYVSMILKDHSAKLQLDTPLYIAASQGYSDMVEILLHNFANVNACSKDGTPVLFEPAKKGFTKVLEYLLQNGATSDLKDKSGMTALIAAASSGRKDSVRLLLQYGADPRIVCGFSQSALTEAVSNGHNDVVEVLVKALAKANEKIHELFRAITAVDVQKLLKEGIGVDERRGDGATPLIVASEQGNLEVAQELIDQHANLDLQDQNGMSALMNAAKQNHLKVVQLLVKEQAILDLKSKPKGWTALMFAVWEGHKVIVSHLVQYGANPNILDKDGKNCSAIANYRGFTEIAAELKKHTETTDVDPFLSQMREIITLSRASKPDGANPQRNRHQRTAQPSVTASSSTMRDELDKAQKRIADLETRVHDLTAKAMLDISEEDISYLERGRLEEEYRNMKERKRKAEQYAIEAKQTAQRLSAENFKLKEDLSREQHFNELTRKSMLTAVECEWCVHGYDMYEHLLAKNVRETTTGNNQYALASSMADYGMKEMESELKQKVTASKRKEDQSSAFQRAVSKRAQELVGSLPKAAAGKCSVTEVKNIILTESVTVNMLQIGIAGLPFSGKTTLYNKLLGSMSKHSRTLIPNGLSVAEVILLKGGESDNCEWMTANMIEREVLMISAVLAQICRKKCSNLPQIADDEAVNVFEDVQMNEHLKEVVQSLHFITAEVSEQRKDKILANASLTFLNLWDIGVSKTVFEVMKMVAGRCKNSVLLNLISLNRDASEDHLYTHPKLDDEYYEKRYESRKISKSEYRMCSSLLYYVANIATAFWHYRNHQKALLIGTYRENPGKKMLQEAKERVLCATEAVTEHLGLTEALKPGMLTVNMADPKDILKVKTALEELIENNDFDCEVPLRWMFLRGLLDSTKSTYMAKDKLLEKAMQCGLEGAKELEEWLKLYQSCASICYSPTEEFKVLHNNIIINPPEFIKQLDRLYYVLDIASLNSDEFSCLSEGKKHLELTKCGLLSHELALCCLGHRDQPSQAEFYLDVLQSLGTLAKFGKSKSAKQILDVQLPKASCWYFMPTLKQKSKILEPGSEYKESLRVRLHLDRISHHYLAKVMQLLMECFESSRELPDIKKSYVFVKEEHYNAVKFRVTVQKIPIEVSILIKYNSIFILVKEPPEIKRGVHPTKISPFISAIFGMFKTWTFKVLQEFLKVTPQLHYDFLVVCPESPADGPDHCVEFDPFVSCNDRLYCRHCKQIVYPTKKPVWRQNWIEAECKASPMSFEVSSSLPEADGLSSEASVSLPEDYITTEALPDVAEMLVGSLSPESLFLFMNNLDPMYTKEELKSRFHCDNRIHTARGMEELVLHVLRDWCPHHPYNARQMIAKALITVDEYKLAVKFHPTICV